jgi:hypothetical protein
MPYLLAAQAAVLWLSVRYARSPRVSARSKRLVVGLTATTFVAPCLWSVLVIPAAVVLFGVGVYLAVHRMVTSTEGPSESDR